MRTKKWIMANDGDGKGNYIIPHSGGEGKQLKGFDARNREIASATGGTVPAKLLKRAGPHVPREKK